MDSDNNTPTDVDTDSHHRIYSRAEIYDIAFDYRDFAKECTFMASCHEDVRGFPPTSWLEMAAGPARHTLEMARRGLRSTALDLSADMVGYGQQLAEQSSVRFDYLQGDMTNFRLEAPVDMAGILLDSLSYVLDTETLDRHLRCVADALVEGGVYLVEMSHPKDAFGEKTAGTEWEMTRDGKTVSISWGAADDPFDAVTQIGEITVRIVVTEGSETAEIHDRARERVFTNTELQAIVRGTGCFDLVAQYGAMDRSIDINHPKAWRNVCVLQKR